MKKFILCLFMFVMFMQTDVLADSSYYEEKHYMHKEGYVRYGHSIYESDEQFKLIPMLITNGSAYRMVVYFVGNQNQTINISFLGAHMKSDNFSDVYSLKDANSSTSATVITREFNGIFYNYTFGYNIEYGWLELTPIIMYSGMKIYLDPNLSVEQIFNNEDSTMYENVFKNTVNGGYSLPTGNVNDSKIEYFATTQYTLEVPLNVKVNAAQAKKIKIEWEQSDDVDYSKWETEIYIQQKGKTKKEIWNSKKSFSSDWYLVDTIRTHYRKYQFNALSVDEVIAYIDGLRGYHPSVIEITKTNIMMRNKYVDENGYVFYSNFVYLYEDDNYSYIANEVDSENIDNTGGIKQEDIENNFVSDSDNYNNTESNHFWGNDDSNMSSGSAVNAMKNMLGDLKQFPSFLYEFFSFIPEPIYNAFTALILLLIPLTLIKMVV